MTEIDTPLVLIPAAGFGKRMGSPAAKELLPDPEGRPLIEAPLLWARSRGWKSLVISRKDKTELNTYLNGKRNVEICLIDQTDEWPHTLAQSERHWKSRNLVLLPDTRFEPLSILDEMAKALNSIPLCFATFRPAHAQTWGTLNEPTHPTQIAEKPRQAPPRWVAWGLIGFQRAFGAPLFKALRASSSDHEWKDLPSPAENFSLKGFTDLTRPVNQPPSAPHHEK